MGRTSCIRLWAPALVMAGVIAIPCAAPVRAQQAPAASDSVFKPQSAFYVELFGSGVAYSLNYDYRPVRGAALRVGAEVWGGTGGQLFILPLTASALMGRGKACFEIGGGPVLLAGNGEFEDLGSNVILSTFVAFRLQPPKEGFFMRAGIGPMFGGGDWLIWPALAFGYTF